MEEQLYSRFLLDEHPISFHPSLALAIGVNEAIILQKINLWLNCKPHNTDGRSWIYNSYKSWQEQLPFFSESTIKRAIKNLRDLNLIITKNFNNSKFDKTLWYSINYEEVDKLVNKAVIEYDSQVPKYDLDSVKMTPSDSVKMTQSIVSR